MLKYTVKHSRRKTVAAYVLENGEVEVRVPIGFPDAQTEKFVREKEAVLTKYINSQLKTAALKNSFSLDIGTSLLFLGEECTISRGSRTEIRNNAFFVTEGNIRNQIIALYKNAAQKIINERVTHFSKITGHTPVSVTINSAKTRWGSCSSCGAVNFSWFLIMANPKAVDYVIIHELSHMAHMNHSDKFWREVEKYEPDYKVRRNELKALAARLKTENWD